MFPTYIIVASAAAAVVLGSHYIVDSFSVTRAAVRPLSLDRANDPTLSVQSAPPVGPVPQSPPPPPPLDLPNSDGATAALKNPACSPNPIPVPTNLPHLYRGPHKMSTPTRIAYVRPEYPENARIKKVQGIVLVEVQIERDGRVCSARVVRSIPLLDQSAVDAVLRWRFTPAKVNDVAIPVTMTLTVNFRLPQ
jgi:protein TonB